MNIEIKKGEFIVIINQSDSGKFNNPKHDRST